MPAAHQLLEVRHLDLAPGAVREPAVELGNRQLEQAAHEEPLVVEHREVVREPRPAFALLRAEPVNVVREPEPDIEQPLVVVLAADAAGERHATLGGRCLAAEVRRPPLGNPRRGELDEEHGLWGARLDRQFHPALLERAVALAQVARRARRDDTDSPPLERGTTWSSVSRPLVVPQ